VRPRIDRGQRRRQPQPDQIREAIERLVALSCSWAKARPSAAAGQMSRRITGFIASIREMPT